MPGLVQFGADFEPGTAVLLRRAAAVNGVWWRCGSVTGPVSSHANSNIINQIQQALCAANIAKCMRCDHKLKPLYNVGRRCL